MGFQRGTYSPPDWLKTIGQNDSRLKAEHAGDVDKPLRERVCRLGVPHLCGRSDRHVENEMRGTSGNLL